jgi:hypothetical protein
MRNWFSRTILYLSLLTICIAMGACQTSPRCCQLLYGTLKPDDIAGRWEPIDKELRIIQPSGSRYAQYPVAEFERQHLIGLYGSSQAKYRMNIIHDLRRYDSAAPELKEWDFQQDLKTRGGPPFDPGVINAGQLSQTRCRVADPSDLDNTNLVCVAEVRYKHIISTMYFFFYTSTSQIDMATLINQALTKTDGRIQEIEQSLDK